MSANGAFELKGGQVARMYPKNSIFVPQDWYHTLLVIQESSGITIWF